MSRFDHEKRTLPEALGIKRKRFEEIISEVHDILKDFADDELESKSEVVEAVSEISTDPVEIALAALEVGETLGRYKADHDRNCPKHGIKATSVEIHVKGGKFSPEKQEKIAKAIREAIEEDSDE